MNIDDMILKNDEKIAFSLRSLYSSRGYSLFKMSKFEEYDLYMKNKDFLISDSIITFNDTNGKLMALKPDVTLSIIKNTKDREGLVQKVFYNENVYRVSDSSHSFREIMQTGLECIGDLSRNDTVEVMTLAVKSAETISENYRFQLSHVGFVNTYLADYGVDCRENSEIGKAFFEKNKDELKKLCLEAQYKAFQPLLETYTDSKSAYKALATHCLSEEALSTLREFSEIWETAFKEGNSRAVIDFSVANSTGYYSGIVFKAYIDGVSALVISGGQYDGLMKKIGRTSRAVGFAVYLDALDRADLSQSDTDDFVNVALPKGRLGEKVYDMFEKAGFECPSIKDPGRKLIFENPEKKVRFFWVKPSDVAIYVERGAADIGVAGRDILLEYEPAVYELCDLDMGKCRMAVAAKKDFKDDTSKTLRVATKFSNIAQKFYAGKGRDIDIIHLNGSIEIAPILGLSDVIVDIVETGKTLYENNLEPIEDIVNISARLISNRSSYQFKKETIEKIREGLSNQVKEGKNQ